MTTRSRIALALSLLALLGAPGLLPAAARAEAAPPRTVEIVAKRFQFTPAEVTLRRGEPVVLRLRSEDVVHGFFTRALGIDATIDPGARWSCRSRRRRLAASRSSATTSAARATAA